MFSQRHACEIEVWRSAVREFEDIVREIDAVDLVAPSPARWAQYRRRLALSVGKRARLALNPGVVPTRVDRAYELFFAVCEKPSELLAVDTLAGWADRCGTSVCWLTEMWVKEMPFYRSALNVLAKFDYVFSHFAQSVDAINRVIRGRCLFAPQAVDAIRFLPYPKAATRFIDVLSIGRRSEQAHQAFLGMARDNRIFYVYDSLKDPRCHDLDQHRFLLANMVKRSRYFVVNPAKWDSPAERGDQSEMGSRYFEGAAAGAILIGERPTNEAFERHFSWPDAVVQLPADARAVEEVVTSLDRQPDRQERVRRTNVVQSLRRHDWAYRWEAVLGTAGLAPLPELVKRKERLADLSQLMERGTMPV